MKFIRFGMALGLTVLVVVQCAVTSHALTVDQEVTAAYLREHPKEFSIEVTKSKAGLIQFKIVHGVPNPMYHVAHLSIYHQGKLIAESSTPSYGRKHGNTFHFSLSADDLSDSKFELSDSALGGTGDEAVPLPGTTVYKFHLSEFVPEPLLEPAGK